MSKVMMTERLMVPAAVPAAVPGEAMDVEHVPLEVFMKEVAQLLGVASAANTSLQQLVDGGCAASTLATLATLTTLFSPLFLLDLPLNFGPFKRDPQPLDH